MLMRKFGTNFNTRALASSIFGVVEDGADLIIDFEDVDTATPSFCHEMLVILKKKKTKIKFINVNENIKLQMQKAIGSL